jgi:hypothetical protein
MVAVHPPVQQSTHSTEIAGSAGSAFKEPESNLTAVENQANANSEEEHTALPTGEPAEEEKLAIATAVVTAANDQSAPVTTDSSTAELHSMNEMEEMISPDSEDAGGDEAVIAEEAVILHNEDTIQETDVQHDEDITQHTGDPIDADRTDDDDTMNSDDVEQSDEIILEPITIGIEDTLGSEIEELLTLLGLSQSMIQVTNEMITPPEGHWETPEGYRAIINPGGVGQPRDGDPRAAFMIYDTERGFEFYRVPYAFEKTQEKIIKAGLPHYLAVRLAYGR